MQVKTVIQFEDGNLIFDGDQHFEQNNLCVEKEIEEVVDDILLKTYTIHSKK